MRQQIKAVQRMQDYISRHINEDISMENLARASLYSPWYSYRLFSQWLKITPAQYIRRLRLSQSALRLRDEKITITDVAFDTGFHSVDSYQRAFYREFGCNPKEYAQNPVPIYLFTPYGINTSEVRKESTMETVKNVFVQPIEKPARKVLIKRGVSASDYMTYCGEVGCDVWGLLLSIKSISGEPVALWLPPAYKTPGTSEYVQGVEVAENYAGAIPEGFEVIDLPAAHYLMFQGEPFAEEDYAAAIEQVWAAIDKYNPALSGYVWDDQNPTIQLEPIGTRGYVQLHAVKKAK